MTSSISRITRRRVAALLAPLMLAVGVLLPGTAQAEYHFTQRGAQIVAKDYVSQHYADTYEENLSASCRPQGQRSADARYKYHRWVCTWVDHSDETYGQVQIIGRSLAGGYYAKVLLGARSL
jgi:hypothetical protein